MNEINSYERPDNGRINLAHHIDLLTGSDHSSYLKTLFTTFGAGYDYYLPNGATIKLPLQLASHAAGTGIPSLPTKSRFIGGGRNSVVSVTGWEAVPQSSSYAAIEAYGASKDDITIAGVSFEGDWTARDGGPGTWTNGNPAAVWIYGTADTLRRVKVVDCHFRNHWGFPVHATGLEIETLVTTSSFYRCGNGVNVNSDYGRIAFCDFEASEGIESSGAGMVFHGNVMRSMLNVGISVGGNVGSSSYPGIRVTDNVIIACTGVGIITAESSGDIYVGGNYVERATDVGIDLNGGSAATGRTNGIVATGNTVISTAVGGTAIGVRVKERCAKALVVGNRTENITGFDTMLYGLLIDAADAVIDNNDFRGKNYAASFGPVATNVFWGEGNSAVAGVVGIYDINAATTFAPGSVLKLATIASKPTAAARFRGVRVSAAGGAGVADIYQVCTKDAADAYDWRTLI